MAEKNKVSEKDSEKIRQQKQTKQSKEIMELANKEIELDCDYLDMTITEFMKDNPKLKLSPLHLQLFEWLLKTEKTK